MNRNKKNLEWHDSILENMNSGFLSYSTKDNRLNYINKEMLSIIHRNLRECISLTNRDSQDEKIEINDRKSLDIRILTQENIYSVLNELFKEINYSIIFENDHNNNLADNNLSRVKKYIKKNQHSYNFLFIGTKFLFDQELKSNLYYEINGRQYKTDETEETYEFILNDETRIKVNEEANADFKYKTIFLSKVAHEFRNPLMCITELIDQVMEMIQTSSRSLISRKSHNYNRVNDSFSDLENSVNDSLIHEILPKINSNLNIMKSISDYLFILVKDLDFFSLKYADCKKPIEIQTDLVNIENILNFCKIITDLLIRRYNKEKTIEFKIENNIKEFPEEVITDEIRLKQLLVNLISNSVKNTNSGSITLKLDRKDSEFIEFSVIDTGIGLSKEQADGVNEKWQVDCSRKNSKMSAGLGLIIVKEILSLMDRALTYRANNKERGSIFSFLLKTNTVQMKKEDEVNVHSHANSIKGLIENEEQFDSDMIRFKPKLINSDIATIQSNKTVEKEFSPSNSK